MRRGRRERIEKNSNIKYLAYLFGGTALIMIITFVITLTVYNKKIKESKYSILTTEKISELVPNDSINLGLEEASTSIGKSIEETIEGIEENSKDEVQKEEKTREDDKKTAKEEIKEDKNNVDIEPEVVKNPEFIMPVDGEITKSFAKDSLIYSETLEEWITHSGIHFIKSRFIRRINTKFKKNHYLAADR